MRSGPLQNQHTQLTRLRDLRFKRAMIALNEAKRAVTQARSRLKLAETTLVGRRAIRARAHRRLYKAMLESGVNARGLEVLNAAFEPHDAGIGRAEAAVHQAAENLEAAQKSQRDAAEQVRQRQRECAVWTEAVQWLNGNSQRAAGLKEEIAQDDLIQNAAWTVSL